MKIDVNNDGKADFSVSLPQILSLLVMFASVIGSYYTLNAKVEKAMSMPPQEVSQKDLETLRKEFDLKLSKVERQAQENMDEVKSVASEMRNNYKRRN